MDSRGGIFGPGSNRTRTYRARGPFPEGGVQLSCDTGSMGAGAWSLQNVSLGASETGIREPGNLGPCSLGPWEPGTLRLEHGSLGT